jgi:hypothetical protein
MPADHAPRNGARRYVTLSQASRVSSSRLLPSGTGGRARLMIIEAPSNVTDANPSLSYSRAAGFWSDTRYETLSYDSSARR